MRTLGRNALVALFLLLTIGVNAASAANPLQAPFGLRVPALATDDKSTVLVWEKPLLYRDVVDYNVYQNGKRIGSANANNDQASDIEFGRR